MAKRRQLAGRGDPNKTAILLDILETKRLITRAQSDAGRYYGWLRRKIYGRTHVLALDPNAVPGHDTGKDSIDWEQLETQYRRLCVALTKDGAAVRDLIADICVYNRCTAMASASEAGARADLGMLRKGLDTIVRVRISGDLGARRRGGGVDAR